MLSESLEETRRLKAVQALGLIDQPEEERFQRITRLARRHFRTARCAISLVDSDRVVTLAQDGGSKRSSQPRDQSFCTRVIAEKTPVVICQEEEDSERNRFGDFADQLGIRFYAGVPLLNPEGYAVGALCVVDNIPRRFCRRDLESLADFAAIVEDVMMMGRVDRSRRELTSQVERLRIRALIDPLTGIWNRGAVFEVLEREAERAQRKGHPLAVCMFDLDRFKRINDTYGHQTGDVVLQETCVRVKNSIRPYDSLGRYGGEEFLVVLPDCDYRQSMALAERIREAVEAEPFDLGSASETITISVGVALLSPEETLETLIERADKALYRAKDKGRNRVEGSES